MVTAPKCERKITLAGKYTVQTTPNETQGVVQLPLKAPVQYGSTQDTLDHFMDVRHYVKLTQPITQSCTLAKGPLQNLDQYLQQWSQNFVPGRKGLDARASVEIYLADLKSQTEPKEPHLIFSPEACKAHFEKLAESFGGKFDSQRFLSDLEHSIASALQEEIQAKWPAVRTGTTLPDDKTRLVRAENLAKAWFKPDHPVRKKLKTMLDRL